VDIYTSLRWRLRRTLVGIGTCFPFVEMFPYDWGESYFVDSELCTIYDTGLRKGAIQLYLVTILLYLSDFKVIDILHARALKL
jgi:hypothetical protein